MRKLIVIMIAGICLQSFSVFSQYAAFINSGCIVFERKINTYAVMPDLLSGSSEMSADQVNLFMQNYRNQHPQFRSDNFKLYFDSSATLYLPENSNIDFFSTPGYSVSYKNKVFSNFTSRELLAEKQAIEQSIFIKDTINRITWKLTSEVREIAGYECRRANALIMDSIYVVAFYTDEIKTKGGPESFNGLPGMILGLVLPHHHISYFASRVDVVAVPRSRWEVPSARGKADAVTANEYNNNITGYISKYRVPGNWILTFMGL